MHSSGAAGPLSAPESSDGLSTGDEFIHPVAGLDAGGASPSGSGEHIRLVVEGSTHQLDKQYGAGAGGVPLRTLMGGGHEAAGGGATVYEPNTQAPFWSGLVPFDFTARPSTHGARLDGDGADDVALAAWFEGASIPFSDQIALIRGRFDRAAMQLGEDLADVA